MLQVDSNITVNLAHGSMCATMTGAGDPDTGYLEVDILLGSEPPIGFDPIVLAAFTLTGMIRFAKAVGGAQNLCAVTAGEYLGLRDLAFEHGGTLSSTIRVTRDSDKLHGDLKIWGAVQLPPLVDVSGPFQERFDPAGPGRIDGMFPIAFQAADGSVLRATAVTRYALETVQTLPREHFRNILLTMTRTNSLQLQQREKIVLFDNKADANRHLTALDSSLPLEERFAVAA